jgi:general secretion pathway protein K
MTPQYSRPFFRAARSERGAALVLALLVVALLMTLVLEFDRSVRLEHRAAGNYRDATAAFYLAKAGLMLGSALLVQDALTAVDTDTLEEPWALLGGPAPLGGGSVQVTIIDEERFFPVNALVTGSVVNPDREEQFRRLLSALEIDDQLADAVIDWIDEDDDVTGSGAERDYYASLPVPYRTHNGPVDSLDELLFIKGMTVESYRRLAPHLTAAPAAGFTINLNTADPVVLGALHDDMTPDLVERLIAERPITSKTDITAIFGGGELTKAVKRYAGWQSRYFVIEAEGLVNGTSKTVTIQVERLDLGVKLLWVRSPA